MEKPKILFLPEVESFLTELPSLLVREGYKNSLENAQKILDEVIDFIYELPFVAHYKIDNRFYHHFSRYGEGIRYSFFKRKSSPNTTWYIFFTHVDNTYIVKHISTNWTEGQYIR